MVASRVQDRDDRTSGETGAALVLALVFMVVVGMLVGAMAAWTGNSLQNAANFQSARSQNYALYGATQTAIQNIRYNPLLGAGQTLNANPPYDCWEPSPPHPAPAVPSDSERVHHRRLLQHGLEPDLGEHACGHGLGLRSPGDRSGLRSHSRTADHRHLRRLFDGEPIRQPRRVHHYLWRRHDDQQFCDAAEPADRHRALGDVRTGERRHGGHRDGDRLRLERDHREPRVDQCMRRRTSSSTPP